MKKVSIVTGSTACIPAEFEHEYEISVVPFMLIIKDKSYRDNIDITIEEFYKALEEDYAMTSTSVPSLGSLVEILEKELKEAERILYITISSTMSGEYDAASSAVDKLNKDRDRIVLLDSRMAATGQGQIAMEAAMAAKRGEDFQSVLEIAKQTASEVKLHAMIDNLEYLKRSGRVSAISALAVNTLNIKPVFQFIDGEAKPVAKPRSKKKALERIAREAIETFRKKGRPINLALFHVLAEDDAKFLENKIRAEAECESSFTAHFTPVMGKHTGPGLVGASFY
ncbi:MAG: DegV family protein [Actinobacteria bacterium]|nr:DegV family protein [Actinomycetota bacterium]